MLPKSAAILHCFRWFVYLVPATSPKRNSKADHRMVCRMSKAFPSHGAWARSPVSILLSAEKGDAAAAREMSRSFPSAGKEENSAKSRRAPSETCPSATLRTRALESEKLYNSDKLTYSIELSNSKPHPVIHQHSSTKCHLSRITKIGL